jgi:hypothetical protein
MIPSTSASTACPSLAASARASSYSAAAAKEKPGDDGETDNAYGSKPDDSHVNPFPLEVGAL